MNRMLKNGDLLPVEVSPCLSRFETPDAGLRGRSAVHVQFGHKLRTVFEVPTVQSQSDRFQFLLEEIKAKLNDKL
ncbi:MAG: hypothetical protein WDN46_17060 [Methylocella sp.]